MTAIQTARAELKNKMVRTGAKIDKIASRPATSSRVAELKSLWIKMRTFESEMAKVNSNN